MAVYTTFGDGAVRAADEGTPVGINVALGAVVIVAATALAARLPGADSIGRSALVAIGLAVFAAGTVDWRAVLGLVLPAWLVMNGFLVNRLGDLSWHGRADLVRVLILLSGGCAGLIAGAVNRRMLEARERWHLGALVTAMATEKDPTAELTEETSQRA